MERWFQNTRGLVIVILAVATGVLLLAIEPGDGFPTGIVAASSGGASSTTTPSTSLPSSVTTTTVARPTLQEGTADTANTIVVQQKLASLGYTVGTPDGSFGPATTAAVKQFQTDKGITPADGVVNQATWNALLSSPPAATTTTAG